MPSPKNNSGFINYVRGVYEHLVGRTPINPFGVGVGAAANYTDAIYKAVIPGFLFKPAFGYPLNKNIPEIRRLAATPYVGMITNTVANEMSALDWEIIPVEDEEVPDAIIKQTENFFKNPNRNEESFNFMIRTLVRDMLEIDAGAIVKVRDLKDNLKEIYVRDGATFTKNPDIFGVMPEINAYYQYGWSTGARPIPFNRNELVYFIMNPRADSIYGRSPIENLIEILQLLTYGAESNLDYFRDNNIPKGIFQMVGANTDDIKAFGEAFQENMRQKDSAGNWRKYFHKMPVVNTDGKFVRIGFSNLELELIQQQQWFTKIVWACYNITPSELGFTEDSNKAIDQVQATVVIKRKLIRPMVRLLEYHITSEIVNDLPWVKGKYENKILFQFNKFDLQEEMNMRQLQWGDIDKGLRTVNEIREELKLDAMEGGDELRGVDSNPFGFQTTGGFGEEESEEEEPETPEPKEEDTEDEKVKKKINKVGKKSISKFYKEEQKALTTSTPLVPKEFEIVKPIFKEIDEEIKKIIHLFSKEIKKQTEGFTIAEIKAMDNSLIKMLVSFLNLSFLKVLTKESIKSSFLLGTEKVELAFGMNFLPNQNKISFLQEHTFDNVKGLEEELKQDLRQELQRGLIDGNSAKELTDKVEKVMNVGKVRAKAIVRTEVNRADNQGKLEGYLQSGLNGDVEWVSTMDKNTSGICKHLNGDKIRIENGQLKGKFKYKGKELTAPPALPNCRSSIVFSPDDK